MESDFVNGKFKYDNAAYVAIAFCGDQWNKARTQREKDLWHSKANSFREKARAKSNSTLSRIGNYISNNAKEIAVVTVTSVAEAAVDAASIVVNPGNSVRVAEKVGAKLSNLAGKTALEQDIKVIGRLQDTAVAKGWKGHDVLNISDWTIKKNDEWVLSGIRNKQNFYTASPINRQNLWDDIAGRETVYGRELRMLEEAGYVKRGDYYFHSDNL